MGIFQAADFVELMCGILAVLGKRNKLDADLCNGALLTMKHRGPDCQRGSLYLGDRLYLGQTVLSITGNGKDTDFTGDRYEALFNGEIYNHVSLYNDLLLPRGIVQDSGTDTEVLVKLHSIRSPAEVYKQLSGMFAYVVYDRAREALLIGRDTVGEKLLYQYEDENLLVFSSEVGPILELVPGIEMNRDVLREYFFTRHLLTSEQTLWKGVRLVPAGQLREYDLCEPRWRPTLCVRTLPSLIDPQRVEDNRGRSEDSLMEELEATCCEVARDLCPTLRYASVVSGGVDSSLASWFMMGNENKPQFLALQFPSKDFPSSSENLGKVERQTGWSIRTREVTEEIYREGIPLCYQVACSPLPTHSYVSQKILAEETQAMGLRVFVLGEGGDEFFGGYEAYRSLTQVSKVPSSNPSPYSGFSPCGVEFEGWQPEALKERQATRWQEALRCYGHEAQPFDRTVQAALLLDATVQLPSVGIRSADQMSMVHSVEGRSFYLRDALMKFALNLPARHRVERDSKDIRFVTKPLLTRLFVRKFGIDLLLPKNGFSGWPNESGRVLVGSNYGMVREVLGPFKLSYAYPSQRHAAEWKLANSELFLRKFSNHI